MTTNTRGVSEAMVDEGCAAFSRLQGRQTSTCIHGGTHTMTELRKAVRATIEAALSAPEPAAQGEAVNVPGYDVGWKIRGVTAYNEAKRKGYRHPECVEAAIKAAPRADGWNACRDAMLAASTVPDVNADVRARFEAWLKRNGIEIFPNWRDDDLAVVSVGKLMQLAALADLSGEVRELVEDALWLLSQIPHNEFSHDYIKDEKRCDACKRIKRIAAALAKLTHHEKP